MRKLLLLALCLLPLTAPAAVYKWVDEHGVVVYSDQPQPGAERLRLLGGGAHPSPSEPPVAYELGDPASVAEEDYAAELSYEGDDPEPAAGEDYATPAGRYQHFAILTPSPDETLAGSGAVAVEIALDPPLAVEAGHRLAVSIDGEQQGMHTSTRLVLNGLMEDEAYHLEVSVVGPGGETVAVADPVTFYID
jgi:hypothetical protein